ncbi:MAG: VCBS repeat-containing protein [Deltaproteobacteria bacterium]|nr:MAG: VCBS repeat-containing protein [Deltaproteobacteria bacterium]
MKKTSIVIFLTILGFLLTGVIQSPVFAAEGPKKVAVVPFTMNADRDLTFLQEGIMDMLASRLAWKGEVQVLEKGRVKQQAAQLGGPLDRTKALEIGRALQADYVIFGSLTVFGESVSLDARILDVPGEEELMTAFKEAKGMDEVIPTVNQFAADINEKIMGRSAAPPVVARTPVPDAPKGPGGLAAMGEDFEGEGLGTIQRFKVQIVSIDAGDVDGDGKNELVFIDKSKVYIYKWQEKTFALFKSIEGGMSAEYIHVSVGDLDRNGKAEIYVSNLASSSVSSLVLEWDGNAFREIVNGQRWLLQVIDVPGQGKTLVGQRRSVGGGFRGQVQYLKREGNGLVSTGPVDLPSQSNVFNFAIADLEGGGRNSTVVLDSSDYLRLYNPGKEEVWRSEEYYGGSLTFIETDLEKNYRFISVPIYVTDVDKDGKREVMICKNRSGSGRMLARFRWYSSGVLHFLTWDQVGLSVKWTTQKQPGPIVSYRVSDLDHDGLPELVIASVSKEKHMLGTPRSQVVVYDLK